MSKDKIIIGLISICLIIVVVCIYVINLKDGLDDWTYKPKSNNYYKGTINTQWSSIDSYDGTMGYSTGGAKDINNFRDNINKGYFPLQSDITYEGLFYDYYFDTMTNSTIGDKDEMFYPSASTAISKDPISNNDEYYITVGLNSNIKKNDFKRKKLNVVVVLDISGSMSSSIDNYYYDNKENSKFKSKMKLAEESVNIMIDQLKDDDSLGIVLFDDDSYLAKPLNKISETNIKTLKKHILDVEPNGGTNFEAGYNEALEVFDKYYVGNNDDYENRIIVITDAMPNIGKTGSSELLQLMDYAQMDNINTTFIGVGVDFNSEVVKNITNVRGANYYKVSNEEEFKTRMGKEFDYMVSPMIYDLNMKLSSNSFKVENIYGTDDLNSERTGDVLHINTLFPSSSNSNGEIKGGVILLKVKRTGNEDKLHLKLNWENLDGKRDGNKIIINFKDNNEYYDNTGIRKAIVLTRYTNTIKDWIAYDRDREKTYLIDNKTGIIDYKYSNENERTSVPLRVSNEYRNTFNQMIEYMNKEIKEIDDSTMRQEVEMMDYILHNK